MPQHAMSSENLHARRVHVDEGHHHVLGGRIGGMLIAIGERGFVAMMTVGDQELHRRHHLPDAGHAGRISNGPQAVPRSILIGHIHQRSAPRRQIQFAVDGALAIRIQHEKLAEMRARVTQHFQTILLGAV